MAEPQQQAQYYSWLCGLLLYACTVCLLKVHSESLGSHILLIISVMFLSSLHCYRLTERSKQLISGRRRRHQQSLQT